MSELWSRCVARVRAVVPPGDLDRFGEMVDVVIAAVFDERDDELDRLWGELELARSDRDGWRKQCAEAEIEVGYNAELAGLASRCRARADEAEARMAKLLRFHWSYRSPVTGVVKCAVDGEIWPCHVVRTLKDD